MALTAYQTSVQTLLHDPNAQFFTLATLTGFINQARNQIAMESESMRDVVMFNTVNATESYFNGNVTSTGTGYGSLLDIRQINYGGVVLESRPWDYFNFYMRNLAKTASGAPTSWCPFKQGTLGSFYIAPVPNAVYALAIDSIWAPIALVDDTTTEALGFPWTDAIQFYAAYLALKDSQRTADAERMFALYEEYMVRARGGVTPLVTPSTAPGGIAARGGLRGAAPPNRAPGGSQPQLGG